jgi:hypothetical protein
MKRLLAAVLASRARQPERDDDDEEESRRSHVRKHRSQPAPARPATRVKVVATVAAAPEDDSRSAPAHAGTPVAPPVSTPAPPPQPRPAHRDDEDDEQDDDDDDRPAFPWVNQGLRDGDVLHNDRDDRDDDRDDD